MDSVTARLIANGPAVASPKRQPRPKRKRRAKQPPRHEWDHEHQAFLKCGEHYICLDITRRAAQMLLARGTDWELKQFTDGQFYWRSVTFGMLTLASNVRFGLPDGGFRYTWFLPPGIDS